MGIRLYIGWAVFVIALYTGLTAFGVKAPDSGLGGGGGGGSSSSSSYYSSRGYSSSGGWSWGK